MYAEQASGKNADAKLYFFKGYPPATTPKRIGGAERDRTADPLLAKQVLSQLSYSPNHRKHLTANRQDQVNPNKPQFATANLICRCKWWAREDLNFRPHAYQACALTN